MLNEINSTQLRFFRSSNFALKADKNNGFDEIFKNAEFFSSGKEAYFRLAKILSLSTKRSLFVPKYFCNNLLDILSKYFTIKFYDDFPLFDYPKINEVSSEIKKSDLVLIVNYFGIENAAFWQDFISKRKDIVFIKDNTFSPLKKNSIQVDFELGSFRKFFDLPDGGYLMKTKDEPLKNSLYMKGANLSERASEILTSKLLRDIDFEKARDLMYKAEYKLLKKTSISRISNLSLEILRSINLHKFTCSRQFFVKEFKETYKSYDFEYLPSDTFIVLAFNCDEKISKAFDMLSKNHIVFLWKTNLHFSKKLMIILS